MQTLRPGRFAGSEPLLVVATPSGHVKHLTFAAGASLIAGRDAEAAMSIPDESVSRRHAEFRRDPLGVRDLGSTNGTRVQGTPVGAAWVDLDVGMVVELGDSVILVRSTSASPQDVIVPAKRAARRSDALGAAQPPERVVVAPAMTRLYSLIDLVARSRLSVLILGETGVGKEVVARALHTASDRGGQRMLTLNCAALAPSLLESELFGFEKGAFTGATAAKPGLFEAASGGTVFLDEIGELPFETQAKLLRVLESGEVLRVGALSPVTVDVRFLAATHRDVAALADQGKFRLDLLFRISGVTLEVPPLRERREDILPLAQFFLARARAPKPGAASAADAPDGDGADVLTPAALAAIHRYPWPGNVRELKSTIERAELLSRGEVIDLPHLSFGVGVALGGPSPSGPALGAPEGSLHDPGGRAPPVRRGGEATPEAPAPFREEVAALERQRILAALDACGGNQSRAAKSLGISRATLIRRLEIYGVVRPRK
jgi:two-component system, NtrC family, response regulator AtoC